MEIAKQFPVHLRSRPVPRGYDKEGRPLGGQRKGAGRKPAPEKNVRVWLTVSKSTKDLLKKLPRGQRVAVMDLILRQGIGQYLRGNK